MKNVVRFAAIAVIAFASFTSCKPKATGETPKTDTTAVVTPEATPTVTDTTGTTTAGSTTAPGDTTKKQ